MIDLNSNCTRIDAAKARENQLQMQLNQTPPSAQKSDSYRKAQSQVQDLDTQVKKGDAQKAETALSSATTAVKQLQDQAGSHTISQRGLDAYA